MTHKQWFICTHTSWCACVGSIGGWEIQNGGGRTARFVTSSTLVLWDRASPAKPV